MGHFRRGALRAAGTPLISADTTSQSGGEAMELSGLADGNTKGLSSFNSGKEH